MTNLSRAPVPARAPDRARVHPPVTGGSSVPSHADAAPPPVTPAEENYLAAIYALQAERGAVIGVRLAAHLSVSTASVTQTLHKLVRKGQVTLGPHKEIELTEAGRPIGEAATRRHRLIERWLQTELGLSATAAHESAHGFEHAFTPEIEQRLFEVLGRPETCPHGNPIPGGTGIYSRDGLYLDDVRPSDVVIVDRITEEAEQDLDLLSYLERHRIGPGTQLTVLSVGENRGAITARRDGYVGRDGKLRPAQPTDGSADAGPEIRLESGAAAMIWARKEGSMGQ